MADNKHHDGKGHGKGKGGDDSATVKSLIRGLLGSKTVAPLSGKGLKKYIRAGAKLRYSPLQNELDKQLRAEQATQQRNKAYYNDYLGRVRNIQSNTQGIYDRANQQLASAQQQANVGDTNLARILNQNRQAQAATMGATPSSAINPLAQAQVARSSAALGNQSRVIGQGATQQSYLADQRRIGARQKIETMQEGLDRIRSVRQDMEDLAREKGAFKTDMLRDLREGERGFLVDLLSGPNARKLAHIQMSGGGGSSSSSSSGGGKHHQPGTRDQPGSHDNRADGRQARNLIKAADYPPNTDWHKIAQFLIDKGIAASVANRIARNWDKRHGKGGKGDVAGQVGGAVGGAGGAAGGHHHR